jgi:MFS family permease
MRAGRLSPISLHSLSIIAGASILVSLSMGMRQTMGLFLGPVTANHVLTIGDFTLAIALQNIVWGVTQPFVGALADRYSIRAVTMTGAVLHAAGLGLTIVMPSMLGFTIGAGLIVGTAQSCTSFSVSMAAVARTVSPARRSLVLGIVSGAGSLGTFITRPPSRNRSCATTAGRSPWSRSSASPPPCCRRPSQPAAPIASRGKPPGRRPQACRTP